MKFDWINKTDGILAVSKGGVFFNTPYDIEFVSMFFRALNSDVADTIGNLRRSCDSRVMKQIFEDHLSHVNSLVSLENKKILDFGSGLGASSCVLAELGAKTIWQYDILGPEIAEVALQRVKFHSKAADIIQNYSQNPITSASDIVCYPDKFFDLIVLNGVVEHIDPCQRKYVFEELDRVLASEGLIFICETPNSWFPYNSHTRVWFSELLPAQTASRYVKSLRPDKFSSDESLASMYNRGMRGASISQIKKMLPTYTFQRNAEKDNWDLNLLSIDGRQAKHMKIIKSCVMFLVLFLTKLGVSPANFKSNLIGMFRKHTSD